jgi:hypothetical protein
VDGLGGRRDAEGGTKLRIVEEPEQELADVSVADVGAILPHLREQIVGVESRLGNVPLPEGDDMSIHARVL